MPSSSEIARVMAEMDRFNKSVTVTEERYEKRVASVGGSYGGLTALLQQGAPGNWASDHKSEAEKFSGWHYVAITSIGKAVRSSDVEAYQEKVREYAKGYNEQDEDTTPLPKWHPLMKLLKRPNPSQSGASFREEMAIQLCLTGSALVWNVPNQMGRTVERYVIPTAIAEPRQPEKGLPKGGWYINPEVARWQIESGWFLYTGLATAIGKVIDARDVQVVRFIHPVFKDEGQSPVSAGALWTDTSEKIDISRHAHLRNGSDPSVIIGIDGVEDEGTLQRMSAKFNEKYAGPSKHGKAMFVNGQNVKVEPVTRTPAEMAYEGAFSQFRDAIMALHGVTPIAAGIEAPSGDDGLYAPLKQFVVGTVQPILDLMAEEDTEQLASQFGEGVSVLYTARAIDDAKLTEQQINTDIAAGAIEVDEIRKLRGRKPWGGEKGKAVAGQGAKEEPQSGLPGLAQGVPGLEPRTGSQALDPSNPPKGTPDPMKLAEEAVAKALGGFADRLSALLKTGDNCGTGAGGFKPGNDCAGGGDGSDAPEKKKRGKKAGKSGPKELWEMTPGEFRRANNQELVDALTDTASYGAMRYVKPGELRVGENGELEIKRVPPGGKLKDKPTWNRLSDGEEEILREKLGVESMDHEGEIERAIQSGEPVPKEVADYFPKNDLIYEHFSGKPSSSSSRANESGGSGNKFTYFIDIGKERDITEEVLDYVNSIHKLPASDRDDLASDLFDKLPILRSDYDKLTEEAVNIDPKYGKWMESRVELQRERDKESDAAREAYFQELRDSANKPKRRTRKKFFLKSSDCGANAEGGGGFQEGNTCGQRRAAKGGQVGMNGEFYAGGQFLPSTDMPKKVRADMDRIASGKVKIDEGVFEKLQPGEFAPYQMIGTFLQAAGRDNEGRLQVKQNNDNALSYLGVDTQEKASKLQNIVNRFNAGERRLSIYDYPSFTNGADIIRALSANLPVPESMIGKLQPNIAKFVTRNGEATAKAKSGSDCGANAQGGGGFQPGNTCARDEGSEGSDEPKGSGGSKPGKGSKVYEWALKKFKDEETARNFTEWFGNSKVVDDDGNPLVVYHQTSKDAQGVILEEGFRTDKGRARLRDDQVADGIFFKPDASDIGVGSTDKAEIVQMATYLKLENPLVVADRGSIKSAVNDEEYSKLSSEVSRIDRALAKEADDKWADAEFMANDQAFMEWSDDWERRLNTELPAAAAKARARLTEVIRSRGHDGMVIARDAGSMGRATKTFIALESNQIKSATGNSGKFDPKDPNITKSGSDCGANAEGGGGFQPGNTCGREDSGEAGGVIKASSLKSKLDGKESGLAIVGPVKLEAYRVGDLDASRRGGVFFSGDRSGAEAYAALHEGSKVEEFVIEFENAVVAGHQNDLTRAWFGKPYGQMMDQYQSRYGKEGATVASAKFDKKILSEAKKRGFDGIVYLKPAPPAETEVVVIGKPGKRVIKKFLSSPKRSRKKAASKPAKRGTIRRKKGK